MLSLLKATWVLSQLLYNHSEPRTLCANPSSTSPQMVRIPSLHIPSHIPQISFMFQVPKSQQHTVRLTELTVSLNGVEVDLGKCLQMHISPLNNINNVKKKNTCSEVRKGQKHHRKHYYTNTGTNLWIHCSLQRGLKMNGLHSELWCGEEGTEWCTYCR